MAGVGDKEAIAGCVKQFRRKTERTRWFLVAGWVQTRQWRAIEQPLLIEVGDQGGQLGRQFSGANFTGLLANHLAQWIDQDHGRPSADAIVAPNGKRRIVDHRVIDPVAHDGGAQIGGDPFGGKLGGVDANDYEFGGILVAELTQLRNVMVAVNSTKGPELE